ncbi:hypothetical protein [Nocardia beijingensis]|uniref:hypothetical protein n=1 Tax=Nocardia beijingensis TaxID=95162 RepID=UPI0033BD2A00
MKPVRRPDDPAKAVKNHLAATVPALVAAPSPTFGLVLPANWSPSSPPALVVFDDGGAPKWPVITRPLLRITVWANGRDRARDIASAALSVLMSQGVPGVATLTEPSGLLEARDTNTNAQLVSFTLRAQSRTLPA